MFFLKSSIARIAGFFSRLLGRGGGTSLPGKVLLALDKGAISRMSESLDRGSVIVSATNGKTTTTNMIATTLQRSDYNIVHNRAGANLASGVATALLYAPSTRGRRESGLGLFEVDEAAMPRVAREVEPRVLLLSNLFRDQLDRYGELEQIADLWAEEVKRRHDRKLVLCADDPLIADLGKTDGAGSSDEITYFGIEDKTHGLPALQHASDSKHCRRCGTAYIYELILLGHLGHYRCPGCGSGRPNPSVVADNIRLEGMEGSTFTLSTTADSTPVDLPLPGMYNVYNALAAAACCLCLDIPLDRVKEGLECSSSAFGRVDVVNFDNRKVSILLIKNPAGANEVVRTINSSSDDEFDLMIALNDATADGRDVSWIWDADFEQLGGKVRSVVCSGTRAEDMALRLKYAGVDPTLIDVEGNLEKALKLFTEKNGPGPLYLLPTYTALLSLYGSLARSGHVAHFWQKGK